MSTPNLSIQVERFRILVGRLMCDKQRMLVSNGKTSAVTIEAGNM